MRSTQLSKAPVSGLFVMMRKVPHCAASPNSVPCGPASASTRSMSTSLGSGLNPVWLIGCSSRYTLVVGFSPNEMDDVAQPRMITLVPPGSRRPNERLGICPI